VKNMWMTQEVLFDTWLFGKHYVWMKDVDGTIWLAKLDEENNPVLTD
jgi:hypothetical protein